MSKSASKPFGVPPLFFIGGELGDLYDRANRALAEPANIYRDNAVELRWIKLYNRALKIVFMKYWACRLSSEVSTMLLKYAKHGFKMVVDLDGEGPIEINEHIHIAITPETYHSLQWVLAFGHYDWERRIKLDKSTHYIQRFDLQYEKTPEPKKQFAPLDIRGRKHLRV